MECCLAPKELLRLDGGTVGVRVRCTSGTVWLTKGDGVDYIIPCGRIFDLPAGESALVEALEPATIHLGDLSIQVAPHTSTIGLAACRH